MESKVAKNTLNCRVVSVSLQGNCAAIAQLLQRQILAAMNLSAMGMTVADLSCGVTLTPETIPLHRLPDDTPIIYRSAIAFKLAPVWQLPALDIANQLTASLLASCENPLAQMYLDFNVEVVSPGWINFRLNEQSLATWLQRLIQMPLRADPVDDSSLKLQKREVKGDKRLTDTPNYFPVQYAHARCCSLLRLAHRQGLITLKDLDFNTLGWQVIEPNPISWLNDDQKADTEQVVLRLQHPAERRLIAQIIDLPDSISNPDRLRAVKLASTLSKAFEPFYSSCRIWGEVKTQTPKLAQARLGLVEVTRGVLRSLLQDQLGVPAPVEL
jgi:arginyl-tRNA synthetase